MDVSAVPAADLGRRPLRPRRVRHEGGASLPAWPRCGRSPRPEVELGGEAMLVTVPGEEDGGAGMLAAIRAGCTGDWAVITEPTRLEIVDRAGRRDHVHAHRRRAAGACGVPPPRCLRAREARARHGGAGPQRGGAQRRRADAVDARPGAALPHVHRPRERGRLVVDRAGAPGGGGPLRRPRRPDHGRGRGGAARRRGRGRRRRRVAARAPGRGADHRRALRGCRRAVRPSAALGARRGRPRRARPAAAVRRRAVRLRRAPPDRPRRDADRALRPGRPRVRPLDRRAGAARGRRRVRARPRGLGHARACAGG